MKVSVIWSSPNESGLTNSAAKQFMNGLVKAGVEVNEIWLNRKKYNTALRVVMAGATAERLVNVFYQMIL